MFMLFCILVSLLPVGLFLKSFIYFKNPKELFNQIVFYGTKKSMESYKTRVYGEELMNKLMIIFSPIMFLSALYFMVRYRGYSSFLPFYILVFEIGIIWLLVIPVEIGIDLKFNK